MIHKSLLISCLAFVVACAATSSKPAPCPPVSPFPAPLTDISHGEELERQLYGVLDVLAGNDTSPELMASVHLEDPRRSGQLPITHARRCLRVVRAELDGSMVVIYLAGASRENGKVDEFLMIASHDGRHWNFTWPADTGAMH